MSPLHESPELEKNQYNASPNDSDFDKQPKGRLSEDDGIVDNLAVGQQNELHRSLKGRHMQMIAMLVSLLSFDSQDTKLTRV